MIDARREEAPKVRRIVYCGPSQSGKTTNLEALERAFPPHTRGQLLRLATETERTLYFDRLLIDLAGASATGSGGRVELFTVPGQSFYLAARQRILREAHGIVFVADSRRERLASNLEALGEVIAAIQDSGREVAAIPAVLQLNKRDAITAMGRDELLQALGCPGEQCIEAVAHEGRGVVETLRVVARRALAR
jgi:signal recognition particle receptor subunit beta